MRIAICDDEPVCVDQMQKYLVDFFKINQLALPDIDVYYNGESMLEAGKVADIAFLDVEMSGLSGIHTGEKLKKRNPNIIIFIVTAFNEYLDEAMEFKVFRYLTKPIDKNRLFRNLKIALKKLNTINHKVAIVTKEKVQSMYMADIIFVEATGRKVTVYTTLGKFDSVENMQHWENSLDSGAFFRTHRSYIVNMQYVSEIGNSIVKMSKGKYSAYLTRRKYKAFKNTYLMYLESMR